MRINGRSAHIMVLFGLAVMAGPWFAACAAGVTGPADASRVEQRLPTIATPQETEAATPTLRALPSVNAPPGSHDITLVLHSVNIEGMTAFSDAQMQDIYLPYLGKAITLDTIWLIAGEMTERYHHAGYFLSQVTVPAQELENGNVKLHVVEGYIGEVSLDSPLKEQSVVKEWIARLLSYRPLKSDQVEAVLLQLNDLPGVNLRAVLEPLPGRNDGAVKLTLLPQKESAKGQVGFDNNGSRYLGPNEISTAYDASFLPLQETSISLLGALPLDRLRYGSIRQQIPVYAATNLEMYGSNTNANPGYTLTSSDINSDSLLLGVALDYKLIRQRQENLTARVAFESRDTTADIINAPLTRDHVRALRAAFTYQETDAWQGDNSATLTLSQGLNIMGASQAGDAYLSRAQATPDFAKAELLLARTQALGNDWSAVLSASGQTASGPLYSSEEFGYGGQAFGRAYDDSEITGDQGVAASTELRYLGVTPWRDIFCVPYGFYDAGAVWNYDTSQPARATGSSAGMGVRLLVSNGISANFGLAFPLTRTIATPLEGNGKNPRYMMQLSYGF